MIKKILLIILFSFVASFVFGADYYIEPKASGALNVVDETLTDENAWTNATSIGTPSNAGTAMIYAVDGDNVLFLTGTYTIPWIVETQSDEARLMPTNSGSSDNSRITFIANPGASPILDMTGVTTNDYNEHIIGTQGQDFITWEGLKLIGNSGTYAAGACAYNSDGIEFKKLEIDGGNSNVVFTSNNDAFRIEASTNILIQRCSVYDWTNSTDDSNTTVIKGYSVSNVIIEKNEFVNTTGGIAPKSNNTNWVIRYNFIENNAVGIYPRNNTQLFTNSSIYQNIIANSRDEGLRVYPENGSADSGNVYYNNTIFNSGSYNFQAGGGHATGTGDIIYNNIYDTFGGTYNVRHYCDGTLKTEEDDHNNYGLAGFDIYYGWNCGGTHYTDLGTWQASGILVGSANPGAGSIEVDSGFVTATGARDTIAEFELAIESPCIGTGRAGADIGADYSLVGIGSDPQATTPTSTASGSYSIGTE